MHGSLIKNSFFDWMKKRKGEKRNVNEKKKEKERKKNKSHWHKVFKKLLALFRPSSPPHIRHPVDSIPISQLRSPKRTRIAILPRPSSLFEKKPLLPPPPSHARVIPRGLGVAKKKNHKTKTKTKCRTSHQKKNHSLNNWRAGEAIQHTFYFGKREYKT